jgi:hypothetical protein
MYSVIITSQTVTLQHAEMIHHMLQNSAVIPTEWFIKTREARMHNYKASCKFPACFIKMSKVLKIGNKFCISYTLLQHRRHLEHAENMLLRAFNVT